MPRPGCLCLGRKVPEVGFLDYRHSNLDFIPSDVFTHERTLEELNVDANQIRDLPRELFYCHGLRKLSVGDNELTVIPPAIATLTNLEELIITKNGIVDLPENIKGCKYLKIVEASVNPLGKLPEGFTQLLHLSELYLNDTFLDFLPGSFGRLSKLRILELRENHLKTLPRSMARLTQLERLDMGNNEFTELPEVLGSLTGLLELWCDTNHIKLIPKEIGSLKQLMFLDASKNRIETIAPEIEGCLSLADLHLSTNLLIQLPETIGRLSNLTSLKIDDNRLTCLPFSIGGLVSLSELNVGANDLEEIPPSIGLLRHLRTLYADENFIIEIPPEMGSCSGLTVLSLRSNNLSLIPDEIGRIPRLRVLNLSDNKIRSLPFSLTKLKQLQALWLAENQTKPLIKLQSDIDIDTGQRVLTCYLLPQQATDDKEDMYSDTDSFHPSLWEEERQKRQQIHFEFADLPDEQEGRLERTPTPYPKEMKQRVQHVRNLAMKQLGNIPNGDVQHVMKAAAAGSPPSTTTQTETGGVVGRRDSPHKPGSATPHVGDEVILGSSKPLSPSLCERHHLLNADKEKQQKDKARLGKKTRLFDNDRSANSSFSNKPGERTRSNEDDGRFGSGVVGRRSDTPNSALTHSNPDNSGSVPLLPQNKPVEDMSYSEFLHGLTAKGVAVPHDAWSSYHKTNGNIHRSCSAPKKSSHHSRGRGYDSDTGYRSDFTNYRSVSGYSSDQGAVKGRRDMYYPSAQPPVPGGILRKRRDGGYSSDAETYVRRRSDTKTKSLPAATATHAHIPHSASYNSIQSSRNSLQHPPDFNCYSNPAFTKRTTIRNDELYEGYIGGSTVNNGSHSNKSHDFQPPQSQTRQKYLTDSMHPREYSPHTPPESDRQSTVSDRSVREPIKEEEEAGGVGRNGDDAWKNQLLAASLKLQKSPGSAVAVQQHNIQSRLSQLVLPSKTVVRFNLNTQQEAPRGDQIQQEPTSLSKPARRALDFPQMSESPRSHRSTHSEGSRASSLPPSYSQSRRSQDHLRPSSHPVDHRMASQPLNLPVQKFLDSNLASCLDNNRGGIQQECSGPQLTGSIPDLQKGNTMHSSTLSTSPSYLASPISTLSGKRQPIIPPSSHSLNNVTDTDKCNNNPSILTVRTDFNSVDMSGIPTPQSTTAGPGLPWRPSQYEKDVAMYKQVEPASQVSSSTDSGYGHMASFDISGRYPSVSPVGLSPGGHGDQSSGDSSYRGLLQAHLLPHDTPIRLHSEQRTPSSFSVTLTKNPGLGFSIAGGLGSPGNPYHPDDPGIFITRVQEDGPGADILLPGDKIIQVNSVDFTRLNHDQAVEALRSSSHSVNISVERH